MEGNSLMLIMKYFRNRYQHTIVKGSFISWEEVPTGTPQGSVLGPLLFNIYLNDLIYIADKADIGNFVDDATPYSCGYERGY